MTDKEFKRLSRPQLVEIIYQLQLKVDELAEENQKLKEEQSEKRIRMSTAGNIAEAALGINDVMQTAQRAAQQYVDEITAMRSEAEASCQKMREETEAICQRLLEETRQKAEREAEEIVFEAKNYYRAYGSVVDAILEEYRNDHMDSW